MRPADVAAHYTGFRRASDAALRWAALPYPESIPAARAAERTVDREAAIAHGNSFFRLYAEVSRVLRSKARVDRRAAALATVEAIRAYAAKTDNLPPTLAAETVAGVRPLSYDLRLAPKPR